ncbi:MAG: RNA methyltransferase [Actinomycetota bacterium]|nr:RNA methyltransferase [Actinomycetota bacterium]
MADDGIITSPANPFVKRLRKLRQRKHREREGAFLVEGIAQVWRAVEHRADIEALVVAPELLTSDRALALADRERASGTRVVLVSRDLFEDTTEREHPSGLAAVVRIHERTLAEMQISPNSVFVMLDEVGNPGNLGSIIRSADASGAGGVIVAGASTDLHHPSSVKASMGALFTVPVCRAASVEDGLQWAQGAGLHVVTTSARAGSLFWEAIYELPLLLVFGSEATGLSPEVVARGSASVRIPMDGTVSSLNLAVSVGLMLYEVKRQLGAGAA